MFGFLQYFKLFCTYTQTHTVTYIYTYVFTCIHVFILYAYLCIYSSSFFFFFLFYFILFHISFTIYLYMNKKINEIVKKYFLFSSLISNVMRARIIFFFVIFLQFICCCGFFLVFISFSPFRILFHFICLKSVRPTSTNERQHNNCIPLMPNCNLFAFYVTTALQLAKQGKTLSTAK